MTTEKWSNHHIATEVKDYGLCYLITVLNPEVIIDETLKEKWFMTLNLMAEIEDILELERELFR